MASEKSSSVVFSNVLVEGSNLEQSEELSYGKKKGLKVSRLTIYGFTLIALGLAGVVALAVSLAQPQVSCQCANPNLASTPATSTTGSLPTRPTGTIPSTTTTTPAPPTTPTTTPVTCPPTPSPDTATFWKTCVDMTITRDQCMQGTPPCPDDGSFFVPRRLTPTHYDIELRPDFYSADPATFSYQGHVSINFTCAQESNTVYLHYRDMTIDDASVAITRAVPSISVQTIVRDVDREFYIIYLSRSVVVGESFVVSMDYSGPINHIAYGISWNDYLDESLQVRYHISTQLENTDSRRTFPCLDDPEMKATFTLSIWRKVGFMTLYNTELDRTDTSSGDGWHLDIYKTSPYMSPYLVAFMVGQFDSVQATSPQGQNTKVWAPTHWIANGYGAYANQVSPGVLDSYGDIFNYRYPLAKLDQMTSTDRGGAMENWGLIMYSPSGLMHNPLWGSMYNKRSILTVIGHEITHQWFGDLVTCRWWEDTWVNEGFAAYYENWPWDRVEPKWNAEDYYVRDRFLRALKADDQGTLSPIHDQTVETPVEISGTFGQQSYSKAGSILRMMHRLVMKQRWNETLQIYLQQNQYDSGSDVLFLSAIDQIVAKYGMPFPVAPSEVMKTWLYQMGFPVVKISRVVGTGRVKVTQKIYLRDPRKDMSERYPSPYGYKWEIPVNIGTSAYPALASLEWLHKDDREFDLGVKLGFGTFGTEDWVLGNHGAFGFYRTNYDPGNWQALAKQLKTDYSVVPVHNRGLLLNDAFYLARAGEMDLLLALQLSEYLVDETEYVPFSMFEDALGYVDNMLLSFTEYEMFRTYMQNQWNNTYQTLGFDPRPEDDNVLTTMYLRRNTVYRSCYFGNLDCIAEALRLFTEWMAAPTDYNIINPDIKEYVYCTAMSNLQDQASWEFLLTRYEYFNSIDDFTTIRREILDGLACSRQTYLLQNYFFMAIDGDPRLRDSDRSRIASDIAANPIGQPIAWDYLNANWTNAPYRMNIFLAATEKFNTEYDLEVLDKFFAENKVTSTSDQATFDTRRTYILANIRWRTTNEENVVSWLNSVTTCPPPCLSPEGPIDTVGSLRLPTNFRPVHYNIEIQPDFYKANPADFSYTGKVELLLECVQSTNIVELQYRQMSIDTISVTNTLNGQSITVLNTTGSDVTEFYEIRLADTLNNGDNITIQIEYSGQLLNDGSGMYYMAYADPDKNITRYQLATQLESTNARKTFPCMDEPAMKATYNVTILRKGGFVAVANMPLDITENRTDNWYADIFQEIAVPMSPYLIAFSVVEDFDHKDTTSPLGTLTREWTQKRFIEAGFADYPDRITPTILDYYGTTFNQMYPLPKEDQITVAGKGGAMENWGLITYGANALLWDPEVCSEAEKQIVNRIVAHEVLHQWFGNLITCKWWSDTWVNEASATYFQQWGMLAAEPTWEVDQIQTKDRMWRALKDDGYGRTHPIHNPAVNTPAEIGAQFSTMTYEKGSCVLRMMHKLVMGQYWNISMQTILERFKYSNVDNNDYTGVLDEVAVNNSLDLDGITPSTVMNTWLNQMGYPVVTITRISDTTVDVAQTMFLLDPLRPVQDAKFPTATYKWEIPIDYIVTNATENSERWWLHQGNAQFTLNAQLSSNDWIIANQFQHGFYRVNYDLSNWNAIIRQLNMDHTVINVKNRAQIIEDSMNLARAELLPQTVGMQATEYLERETEYLPWAAAESTLAYVNLMLSNSPNYGDFLKYMTKITQTNFDSLGWNEKPGDLHFDIFLRSTILQLACKYGNNQCINQAQSLFNNWMASQNDKSIVRPDIREAVYCTVIKNTAGRAAWDFLFEQYTSYKDYDHFSNIRNRMAIGMTCSTDLTILSNFYRKAKEGDSSIHQSDRSTILQYIARNPVAHGMVWTYLDENWDTHPYISNVLYALTENFNTVQALDQAENLFAKHPSASLQSTYNDIRMIIQANVRWWLSYGDTVLQWLSSV